MTKSEERRIHAELGKRIKTYREMAQMTQEDLAEAVGRTERTIERYETGEQAPTLATVYRIADTLRISIGKLVKSPSEWSQDRK